MKIPLEKLSISRSRSSGPGGQHVNKTESKVELRFHVESADWISEPIKARFCQKYANRINRDGDFILSCDQHRSAQRNLEELLEVLEEFLKEAAIKPKIRKKTKPTRSSKEKRLQSKEKRSVVKKNRKKPDF